MSVQVPFLRKDQNSLPFRRIIERTAREMGLSDYSVALITSHIFEGIIREVAMGNAVSIPVLGMFAPVSWKPRVGTSEIHAAPRFAASRAFRNEVAMCCSPHPVAQQLFVNYTRNHHRSANPRPDDDRKGSTGFTGFSAFRDRVEAQARAVGIDPYDVGA